MGETSPDGDRKIVIARRRMAMRQYVPLAMLLILALGSTTTSVEERVTALDVAPFVEKSALLELEEGLRKDGCSGAYEKFKTNVAAIEQAKVAAIKKAAGEERKARKLAVDLKQCKDGQKEVMKKADFKKKTMKKQVEAKVEKKVGKDEKKLKK